MRTWKAVAATALIVALLPVSGQAQQQSVRTPSFTPKQKVYSGNDGTRTARRFSRKQKEAILSGSAFASTTQIVCPPSVDMRRFDPEADYPGKDYGSFLAMRGGAFGYVTREWLNGCEQRLSFPRNQIENFAFGEAQGDYKPTYSPDGKHIAFFRRYSARVDPNRPYSPADEQFVAAWHTRATVIDSDGGTVRYLSDETNMNSNPMWTRAKFRDPQTGEEGYRVTWTRLVHPAVPSVTPRRGEGCWNDVRSDGTSTMGGERCWTDAHPYQFAYSSLNDGRVLVRKEFTNEMFLVTPDDADGTRSQYDELVFEAPAAQPGPTVLRHKISISDDETRIAYMLVDPAGPLEVSTGSYFNARLAYADFDAETATVSNEVIFTDVELANITWYPQFTKRNEQILFACGGLCPIGDGTQKEWSLGQIYEYDLATRPITKVSHHQFDNAIASGSPFRMVGNEYRYPNVWGAVK